jgi:hypothetical protein
MTAWMKARMRSSWWRITFFSSFCQGFARNVVVSTSSRKWYLISHRLYAIVLIKLYYCFVSYFIRLRLIHSCSSAWLTCSAHWLICEPFLGQHMYAQNSHQTLQLSRLVAIRFSMLAIAARPMWLRTTQYAIAYACCNSDFKYHDFKNKNNPSHR